LSFQSTGNHEVHGDPIAGDVVVEEVGEVVAGTAMLEVMAEEVLIIPTQRTEQQVTTSTLPGKISTIKVLTSTTARRTIHETMVNHEEGTQPRPGEATQTCTLFEETSSKDTIITPSTHLSTCRTATTTNNFLRLITTNSHLICNNGRCRSEDGGRRYLF
jgi:hypothetical protein